MIETRPLEVKDFSQGITDYYIDGAVEAGQKMDNLILNPNKELYSRWGSEVYNEAQLPLGVFRVNELSFYDNDLFAFQQKRGYFVDSGTWTEVLGPASGTFFPAGAADSIISSTPWRGHIYYANDSFSSVQKLYRDNLGDYQVRNSGLPEVPAGVSITNPSGSGANYLYTFVLRYDYKVDTVSFIDRGPTYLYPTTVSGGTIAVANGAAITLPAALPTVENWDTANIDIEIYRTTDAGDVFYYVDKVSLGVTAYTDETADADLQLNEQLYTTGGVYSNETPPKCQFVNVVNNIGYYGVVFDGTEVQKTLLRQSIPGDPDSVPSSFFEDTEEDIKGLGSIFDRPLVFCERYVYRIDNQIDSVGGGSMLLRRIDDKAGCVSNRSIVQTTQGLFWAGNEGFYFTDGFKVLKISGHLDETYKTLILNDVRKKHIEGTYDPSSDRVYWSVCLEDGSNEPDTWFILDLKYGIRPTSTFTTASNGDYFRPTALAFKEGSVYRGDTRGYVLEHNSKLATDPKIDTSIAPSQWEELTIVYDYLSSFMDFGAKFYRKFVPRILISAGNATNLSLGIFSSNDNNRVRGELKPIRYRDNITWGESLPLWGDNDAKWNSQGLIEEWRRFPAKGLRCNYKQVQLTNAIVQIITSDLIGTSTVSQSAKTATLGGSYIWLPGIVDYFISFENDDYNRNFQITARTDTTITFADPNGEAPVDGVYEWILRGKPKGEVLELNGYVLHWSYLSKSHTPFSASSLGSSPNG